MKFLFGGVLACILLVGCVSSPPTPESATLSLSPTLSLQMERVAAHPMLAEYNRTIRLHAKGKVVASSPVMMDTGGYKGAKIYQMSPNQIIVDDLFDTYLIDKSKLTIIQKDVAQAKRGIYLGKFDEDANQNWTFIKATKKSG